jgi:nucleoside-diphosphate-sugar epimerase
MVKNVLLTGAEGFIGKRLKFFLESSGYNVKSAVWKKNKNYKKFSHNDFCFERIDSQTDWSNAFKSENIDTVIHLAARVHILKETSKDPFTEFFSVNCQGTKKLAEEASKNNVRRFIFLSTIGVNGNFTVDAPFSEKSKVSPKNYYSISKYLAELELLKIQKQTGMEVVILRPPLVYGPEVGANFLKLLNLVNKTKFLPFKNVSNKKSFIYLDNLCHAILLCIENKKAGGEIFLISDSMDISTKDLVLKIAESMDKKIKLFSLPDTFVQKIFYLSGRPSTYDSLWKSLEIDSSKINMSLGFKPRVSFDNGVYLTVENYLRTIKQKN